MKSNEPVLGRSARRQIGRSCGLMAVAGLTVLSAQAALIDQWNAADIADLGPGEEVWRWPSSNGRTAWQASLQGPTYWPDATPAGGPVLRFAGNLLEVDPPQNPAGGLGEFSLAVVLKFNAPSETAGGAQWWQHTPIIDSDSADAGAADWGTALRANGDVAFGAGNPDTTTYSAGASAANEKFHVVIATFKAGQSQTIQLDNWDPVAATGTLPADPRAALRMTIGGATAGEPAEQLIAADIAEIRFFDTALSAAESLELANELAGTHGVQFERLINTFAADPQDIAGGESTTLSWSTAPDATLTIEPEPGNVDDLTTNGQGQVTLTPANDTLYTLVAVRGTTTNRLSARVTVQRTAAESLVDVWDAADAGSGAIAAWTSQQGRSASLANGATQPTVVAEATSAGTPAVDFAQSLLTVAAGQNPLGDAVEATIAYVVRLNAAPTRDADPQWWGQTGIVDARSAAGDDSWGCVVNPAGAVGFGAGNPDQTLYSAGESLIDDKFHVVIQTWGGGAMSLQVDDQDPVVSTSGVSELPRGATGMALGGLATGEPEARFAGQLAEVRFYDESLSAAELDTVRRELVEKHGLGGGGINVPPFEIIARGINGEGQFYVTIESVAGANYRLLHKASLSEADWTEVASGRAGGATLTLTDTRGAAPGGYYQVVADATTGGELEPFMILRGGVSGPNEAYLVVQSVAGHTYKLLKQAALGGPDWVEVDSVTAAGEETILTDSEASTASAFYRVLGE